MKLMLLENKDYKQMELVNLFQKHYFAGTLSLTSIAKELSVDKRTARKQVELLIDELQSVGIADKMQLALHENGQVTFDISYDFNEDVLIAFYSKRSILFQMLYDILLNDFTSLEDFAAHNFVTVGAIYQKLPYAQELLRTLNVTIDLRSESRFEGSERQIRQFYFYLLFYIADYIDFPYRKELADVSFGTIHSQLWVNILYYRISGKNYVKTFDEVDRITTYYYSEAEFHQLYRKELEALQHEMLFDDYALNNELHSLYISSSFLMAPYLTVEELSKKNVILAEYSNLMSLEKRTLQWIESFANFFEFKLEKMTFNYLYHVLLDRHINYAFTNGEASWFFSEEDVKKIKRQNPVIWHKLQDFFTYIKENDQENLFPEAQLNPFLEFAYITIIADVFSLLVPPVKIYVYSSLGYLSASYIKKIVSSITHVPLQFVEDRMEPVDITIRDGEGQPSNDGMNIFVHTLPHEVDLAIIQEKIEEIYYLGNRPALFHEGS